MTANTQDAKQEHSVEFLLYNEKRLKNNFAELQKQHLLALQKLRATEQAHAALQEQVNAIHGRLMPSAKAIWTCKKNGMIWPARLPCSKPGKSQPGTRHSLPAPPPAPLHPMIGLGGNAEYNPAFWSFYGEVSSWHVFF